MGKWWSICKHCMLKGKLCLVYPYCKCCECIYYSIDERGKGYCFMEPYCYFERKETDDWWKEYDDLNIFVKAFWWVHDEFLGCLSFYLINLPLYAVSYWMENFFYFIKNKFSG